MPETAATLPRLGLTLRRNAFRRACAGAGATTIIQKAKLLGLDAGTISRVERGSSPSAKFIAHVLAALPSFSFEGLFDIGSDA